MWSREGRCQVSGVGCQGAARTRRALHCLAILLCFIQLASAAPNPPIAIPISLEREGYVTVVIEDKDGHRVRNLVSEAFYEAGDHTVYWDGMDDHGRADIGPHGNYTTTGSIVAPGGYRVRGIVRDQLDLRYEFSVYNPVNPPWRTPDTRGQWLADHSPPSSILYVPGKSPRLLIGSSLAEGAHGLIWTDLAGKKLRGVQSIGRGWAGAVRLTRDKASQPADVVAYGLGASRHGEVSLVAIGEQSNAVLFSRQEDTKHHRGHTIVDYPVGGLAVHDGLAAISFPAKNEIVLVRLGADSATQSIAFESPRGLAFDAAGRLLVLSGKQLLHCSADLADRQVLIRDDLDAPREVMVGPDGAIYIADHGDSHQVKVFSADGQFRRAIGKPGAPTCGPYDETKMHRPMGMTVTPDGNLWVAEEDYQPKRVSVWRPDSSFKQAFYGPTEYGGGGKLDPLDKTRFYYFGMEFELDWGQGTNTLKHIFFRRDNPANLRIPDRYGELGANPETPVYLNGRQYMTNTHNGRPTMGPLIAGIWRVDNGIAKPVAALGQANYWDIFKSAAYKDRIPAGIDLSAPTNQQWTYDRTPPYENALLFAWSDTNDDHQVQPDEVTFAPGKVGGLNQDNGLTFYTADGLRIAPQRVTDSGVPVYNLADASRVCPLGVPIPYTTVIPGYNGDFAVSGFAELTPNGRCLGTVSGITRDGRRWVYPSQWTGLHASQSYPVNRQPQPGDLIGITKVIGPSFKVAEGKEELWALNANSGQIYLFTIDGFFVASLFRHGYFAEPNPPVAKRGMLLNDTTSDGEGFYQTITRTANGQVYLQAMNHTSSLIRLDGLDSIRRLEPQTFSVSQQTLDACVAWFTEAEAARQRAAGGRTAQIAISAQARELDGDLADWLDADWLPIDDRTWGALAIADGHLYAAWKTLHTRLLENSGVDPWQGMFKTGGALDIMLSTTANGGRSVTVGDQRLLISKVNGQLRAIHYEQRSERTGHAAEIASPNRTVAFDYIADVSDRVRLAEGRRKLPYRDPNQVFRKPVQLRRGFAYEVAVPLDLLALAPVPGKLSGDIGVLLGNGTATIKRLYWSNKNTAMLFDAPEESLLKPALWGQLNLVEQNATAFAQSVRERGARVEVLSNGMGGLQIDASRVGTGEAPAAIAWSGEGRISNRSIGRGGYIIFRHRAEGHWDADEPLVNIAAPFSFTVHQPGRFKDGLYAGSRPKDVVLLLDGENCFGSQGILGATLWAKQRDSQYASWDVTATDEAAHQLTAILGSGAKEKLYLAPADDPGRQRELISFDGSQGMSAVQFSFSGSVRLTLEQPPYTDEEIENHRPPANIMAIFLD